VVARQQPRILHQLDVAAHGLRRDGLSGFYRFPARVAWIPTGNNAPDYPKPAQLWWKNVAVAVTGEKTPPATIDRLAKEMDW
jgi:glycerol transport system substrate-binding protein